MNLYYKNKFIKYQNKYYLLKLFDTSIFKQIKTVINNNNLVTFLNYIKKNKTYTDTFYKLDNTMKLVDGYTIKNNQLVKCNKNINNVNIIKNKNNKYSITNIYNNLSFDEIIYFLSTFSLTSYGFIDQNTFCKKFVSEHSNYSILENINDLLKDANDIIYFNANTFYIKSRKLLIAKKLIHLVNNIEFSNNNEIIYLDIIGTLTFPYQINFNNKYENSIIELFSIITNIINKNLNNNLINNIPFQFYHMHIVNINTEKNKLLCVLHTYNEDPITNYDEDQFIKFNDTNINRKPFLINDLEQIKLHNHIALIDFTDNINITLFSPINDISEFLDNNVAINYNLFGNHICELNYHINSIPTIVL